MRKEFRGPNESFSAFSATLVAGDTVIFTESTSVDGYLYWIAELLRKGIVVNTPQNESLDNELRKDADAVERILSLATIIDRNAAMVAVSRVERKGPLRAKRQNEILLAKVDQLVEQEGLSVVVACRRIHCRPSDYYIYKHKLKRRSYGG